MSTVKKKMFLVNSKLDIALATKESFSSLKLPRSFGVEVKHKKRRKKNEQKQTKKQTQSIHTSMPKSTTNGPANRNKKIFFCRWDLTRRVLQTTQRPIRCLITGMRREATSRLESKDGLPWLFQNARNS